MLYSITSTAKNIFRTYSIFGSILLCFVFFLGRVFFMFSLWRFSHAMFSLLYGLSERQFLSESKNIFKWRQLVEFNLNLCQFKMSFCKKNRLDPLFESCHFTTSIDKENEKFVGDFEVQFTHLGLRIDGFLYQDLGEEEVVFCLNGKALRMIPVRSNRYAPPFFHYHIKREVLARFPSSSEMSLCVSGRNRLISRGNPIVEIKVPHGDGSIFDYLEAGGRIDKKGFLALTPDTIHARQARYLDIYSEARKYFTEQFGSPLFVMYGTLLGLIREGDFIQGDDDFDAGYISHQTNAKAVKQETMQLVVDMVLAGFTCSFNRNGRLFRLRLKDDKPDVHLDVRPVWYEEDHIWAHKQARLPLKVDDFLPVETRELRGVPVDVPRNAEGFLRAYYGPGWKVPDPGYSNASQKVPRRVKRKLNSVCISPKDYQDMQQQIEERRAEHPNAGKLIATGLHPLYPLEEYEANCEW